MRRQHNRRGSAAIEFGLMFPILMLTLATITDAALAINTRQSLSRASRDAVRAGSRVLEPPGSQDGTLIIEAAELAAETSMTSSGIYDGSTTAVEWYYDEDTSLWWIAVDLSVDSPGIFTNLSPFGGKARRRFRMVTRQQPPAPPGP